MKSNGVMDVDLFKIFPQKLIKESHFYQRKNYFVIIPTSLLRAEDRG